MNNVIISVITILIFIIGFIIGFKIVIEIDNQEEYIKELEQALTEQKQEVEVYRGILEEYQIEGIINE